MNRISSPIHVATIHGRQLRFYRTPYNDGRPDLPWHSVDDLQCCLGFDPEQRRSMLKGFRTGPFPTKTIATEDGLVTIAPHYIAQNVLSATAGNTSRFFGEYSIAMTDAGKKLTAGLSLDGLCEWLVAALERHDKPMKTSK